MQTAFLPWCLRERTAGASHYLDSASHLCTADAYTPGHLPDLDEILKVVESLG